MKKLNLLSRAEMKKVMGGNVPPGEDHPCWDSYFYEGSDGCGTIECYGVETNAPDAPEGTVNCKCKTYITVSPPCAYA